MAFLLSWFAILVELLEGVSARGMPPRAAGADNAACVKKKGAAACEMPPAVKIIRVEGTRSSVARRHMAARLLGGGVRIGRSGCWAFGGGDRCVLYAALACLVLALVLCCLGVVFSCCCGAPSPLRKEKA